MVRQLVGAVIVILVLSSCQFTRAGQKVRQQEERIAIRQISCAEPRLHTSFDLHQKSKDFLASYYKTRKESELFFAWYASEDSVFMARSIRECVDKRNKHFHAVQNIMERNQILQRLIAQNMRSGGQTQVSELYLNEYRKIFVRDIQ